jgi:hypothetical protein
MACYSRPLSKRPGSCWMRLVLYLFLYSTCSHQSEHASCLRRGPSPTTRQTFQRIAECQLNPLAVFHLPDRAAPTADIAYWELHERYGDQGRCIWVPREQYQQGTRHLPAAFRYRELITGVVGGHKVCEQHNAATFLGENRRKTISRHGVFP